MKMKKDWSTIELLRYSRHDWLNKMQLIKSNLELDKPEQAKGIIEEIILEAQNEAKLSTLHMPKLAELLLTANWMGYSYSLEYEILQVEEGCKEADEIISNWLKEFFQLLSGSLSLLTENSLKISILQNEGKICFSFDLQGKIKEEKEMINFLEKKYHENFKLCIEEKNENEWIFDIEISCTNSI